jgi:hypothetical protein
MLLIFHQFLALLWSVKNILLRRCSSGSTQDHVHYGYAWFNQCPLLHAQKPILE